MSKYTLLVIPSPAAQTVVDLALRDAAPKAAVFPVRPAPAAKDDLKDDVGPGATTDTRRATCAVRAKFSTLDVWIIVHIR